MGTLKSPTIKGRQIGKNFNVVIGDETFTLTGTKEELLPAKEALKLAMEKPTKKNLDSLKKSLTPKTTAEKEVKEKEVVKAKAVVQKTKKEVKSVKKVVKKENNDLKSLKTKIENKEFSEEELAELRKLLAEPKTETKVAPVKRRGEY